jgi:hypothetical protein
MTDFSSANNEPESKVDNLLRRIEDLDLPPNLMDKIVDKVRGTVGNVL